MLPSISAGVCLQRSMTVSEGRTVVKKLLKKCVLVFYAAFLASSVVMAGETCTVSDPTGTPLNVRLRPNGPIVGALHNETQVLMDLVKRVQGRQWAKVIPLAGESGWVFRDYLRCEGKEVG